MYAMLPIKMSLQICNLLVVMIQTSRTTIPHSPIYSSGEVTKEVEEQTFEDLMSYSQKDLAEI